MNSRKLDEAEFLGAERGVACSGFLHDRPSEWLRCRSPKLPFPPQRRGSNGLVPSRCRVGERGSALVPINEFAPGLILALRRNDRVRPRFSTIVAIRVSAKTDAKKCLAATGCVPGWHISVPEPHRPAL